MVALMLIMVVVVKKERIVMKVNLLGYDSEREMDIRMGTLAGWLAAALLLVAVETAAVYYAAAAAAAAKEEGTRKGHRLEGDADGWVETKGLGSRTRRSAGGGWVHPRIHSFN
jgi:hypothetical protein